MPNDGEFPTASRVQDAYDMGAETQQEDWTWGYRMPNIAGRFVSWKIPHGLIRR